MRRSVCTERSRSACSGCIIFTRHDGLNEVALIVFIISAEKYVFFLVQNSHLELASTFHFISFHGVVHVTIQFLHEIFFLVDPFLCPLPWHPPNRCFMCILHCGVPDLRLLFPFVVQQRKVFLVSYLSLSA